jgi:hypothetical protein
MHPDPFRRPLGLPLAPAIRVGPDQFLLLGVQRDHRCASRTERIDAAVDVLDLVVPVRMRRPLDGLLRRSSSRPARMVVRDSPIARVTIAMPPSPNASASAPAHKRVTRSSITGRTSVALRTARPTPPGRSLEPASNLGPRGMVVVLSDRPPGGGRESKGTEFGLSAGCDTFLRAGRW